MMRLVVAMVQDQDLPGGGIGDHYGKINSCPGLELGKAGLPQMATASIQGSLQPFQESCPGIPTAAFDEGK